MKTYLKTIQILQKCFLFFSIGVMLILPLILAFLPQLISNDGMLRLYDISHVSVFFVMIVRPLADIFFNSRYIRPLVILRKGVGVLAASVVMSVIFSKIIINPVGYLSSFGTYSYWSLEKYALIAHLADISAIFLIITSNNLSKRILGVWWKRIQKLSYVFFYASSLYVYLTYDRPILLVLMVIVTLLTLIAYFNNRQRRMQSQSYQ